MAASRGAYTADARVREALSSNMDALVAVGLIVGTLLGAALFSVFFAVQIGAPRLLCRFVPSQVPGCHGARDALRDGCSGMTTEAQHIACCMVRALQRAGKGRNEHTGTSRRR